MKYAGNLNSLRIVSDDPRYRFVRADICDELAIRALYEAAQFQDVAVIPLGRTDLDLGVNTDNL